MFDFITDALTSPDPIVSAPTSGPAVTVGTGVTAMQDFNNATKAGKGVADATQAMGSGPGSTGMSVLAGLTTLLTHDPSIEGGTGIGAAAERTTMAGMDMAWGLMGGPAAVVDTLLGGNGIGLAKAGVSGMMAVGDAIMTGDTSAIERQVHSTQHGDFGAAAGGLSVLGDAIGQGIAGSEHGFDTGAMDRFTDGVTQQHSLPGYVARGSAAVGDAIGEAVYGGGEQTETRGGVKSFSQMSQSELFALAFQERMLPGSTGLRPGRAEEIMAAGPLGDGKWGD